LRCRLRCELFQIVNSELLLDIGDLGHGVVETALAEALVLLFLKLLAQFVIFISW
jgi:hypothetical protein